MLRVIYPLVFVLLLLFLVSKLMAFHNTSGVNINACIGYLMAIPATICLGRLSPRVRWDQMLGLLSFPLFLVHTPARNFCENIFPIFMPRNGSD
jgi:peptidoglycan/LPS O-acetylase OafA/YrhL